MRYKKVPLSVKFYNSWKIELKKVFRPDVFSVLHDHINCDDLTVCNNGCDKSSTTHSEYSEEDMSVVAPNPKK